MEKDYYKRYRVSFNPESDKDREIIDYLEKFSSGSARTYALKELLYNGMQNGYNDIVKKLDSINEKLVMITKIPNDELLFSEYDDGAAGIYELFCEEYEPELKRYNSRVLSFDNRMENLIEMTN